MKTKQKSRRRGLMNWGATTLVAVAAAGLIGSGNARAQVPALQIIPLAQGDSHTKKVKLRVQGPSEVLQARLVFQPGGETGWHFHPGPVVVVVKGGDLTEQTSDGCLVVHPAGSVFFETDEEVHRAFNRGGGVVEAFVTFISPRGTNPLIPVQDPGGVCGQ